MQFFLYDNYQKDRKDPYVFLSRIDDSLDIGIGQSFGDDGGFVTFESKPLTEAEKEVLNLLANRHLSISELADRVACLGSHELHETMRKRTTPRKMFQVIRDLRNKNCPIVGDKRGIYIADTTRQVREFADGLEQKARADYESMMQMRNTLLSMIDL
jgi:hypothetical protein